MSDKAFAYAPTLRPAFLAHMADRLNTLICAQTKDMLQSAGALTPVNCVSAMIYLLKRGSGSLSDIAETDGQSHQLVSSRIAPLEALGLVTRMNDPDDARRKLLKLTAKGKSDAQLVANVCEEIAIALESLSEEVGVDLLSAIEIAERSLQRLPIAERAVSAERPKRRARRA